MTARLVADDLSKRFANVAALRQVTLEARPGEVLALLGENGAGKSTLLKILNGDYQPDKGRLLVDGQAVSFASPRDAHRHGLRVIYQEPEIVPHVSVAENIYIGDLGGRGHRYDRRKVIERAQAEIDRLGFTNVLAPDLLGTELSPAQRQMVEILRALINDPKVLAFDEPTSSLSDAEVELLFTLIDRLRGEGVAIIYVSHRMNEIFRVADRVAVLRDGALAGTRDARSTNEQELVRLMTGRDLSNLSARDHAEPGPVVLSVSGLDNDDIHDISFDVHASEVVGIAGLVGAGRSELAHALIGNTPLRAGEIRFEGRPLKLHSPADAVRAGIGFAPEERKAQALLLERSVRDNVSLAMLRQISRAHVIRRGEERRIVSRFVERLNIRTPSIEQEVGKLSGGNQQKTVLARWLARRPKLLILDEPTRGVDVGAKAEIYGIINSLAAEGMALLVISSELPEILGLADRILVMQAGRITGELGRADATEEAILTLAMADSLSGAATNSTATSLSTTGGSQ
jgi:L-arabinose transport system ATP-binding protein